MVDKTSKEPIQEFATADGQTLSLTAVLQPDMDVLCVAQELVHRDMGRRGYDVIRNCFFVEETIYADCDEAIPRKEKHEFTNFEEYFGYLGGDILTDACYTYLNPCRIQRFLSEKGISISSLMERRAFVTCTIDDFSFEPSVSDLQEYKRAEKRKKYCLEWIDRFCGCSTSESLCETIKRYYRSKLCETVDLKFFLMNYVYIDPTNNNRFLALMKLFSTHEMYDSTLLMGLCSVFEPDMVLENYKYSLGSKMTQYRHRKKLQNYIEKLKAGEIQFFKRAYFDKKTHFFCEEIVGRYEGACWNASEIHRYFSTFEDFIQYRHGDLRNTDLSDCYNLKVNFSEYITNERTRYPISDGSGVDCSVHKEYKDGGFHVSKLWKRASGDILKKKQFEFVYFFDFTYFLKNDLSEANLICCDGLINLSSMNEFQMQNISMRGNCKIKFGIPFKPYELNAKAIGSFVNSESNEYESTIILQEEKELPTSESVDRFNGVSLGQESRIYYVSDIHLLHRLQNAHCVSNEDEIYVIEKIADSILSESCGMLLIGGDVASDYEIFKKFVKCLAQKNSTCKIVFILGNHELWPFPGKCVTEIAQIYRKTIEENGMYFLQNELMYVDGGSETVQKIRFEDLKQMDTVALREKLRYVQIVILGGLGFSGYNDTFNADNGIYRGCLTRKQEVDETIQFENLYKKILQVIYDKNAIVFTHTPLKDWCKDTALKSGVVYLSGHTHRNIFYDDGDQRVFADNQVGYHKETVHPKYFLLSRDYDIFSDYKDGIYEITLEQYKDFYLGKNIQMTFEHKVNTIYMLKKSGYYCFLHKSTSGVLTFLNGGTSKALSQTDIEYYYNNMDKVVSIVKNPLAPYLEIQKGIAERIAMIGGRGKIHGCIIDIDWFNHIFVNPCDLKITPYWASDMIYKQVYPDIATLLMQNCPELYGPYLKLIGDCSDGQLFHMPSSYTGLPQRYLSTDIYKVSRFIKKLQRLESNILTVWPDNLESSDNSCCLSGYSTYAINSV